MVGEKWRLKTLFPGLEQAIDGFEESIGLTGLRPGPS
jgi:hypothetical protein